MEGDAGEYEARVSIGGAGQTDIQGKGEVLSGEQSVCVFSGFSDDITPPEDLDLRIKNLEATNKTWTIISCHVTVQRNKRLNEIDFQTLFQTIKNNITKDD